MLTIKMLLPTLDNQVGILIDDRLNLLQVICQEIKGTGDSSFREINDLSLRSLQAIIWQVLA